MVGAKKRNARHLQVERLGGPEVDSQLKSPWQLGRQIARVFALEEAPGIEADLMVGLHQSGSIAHQATALDVFTPGVGSGQPIVCRKRDNSTTTGGKERVGTDQKRIGI